MNAPNNLDQASLLDYAMGTLDPARSLILGCYLTYHDDLLASVQDTEAMGGTLLDALPPATVHPATLEGVLQRLDDTEPAPTQPTLSAGDYPEPLLEFLRGCPTAPRWRWMGPGMQNAQLWHGPDDTRLWMLRARGGIRVPRHGHRGEEWTLLLQGGYTTEQGHFAKGDLDLADQHTQHQPYTDPGQPCVCLVMTEGPIRLEGRIARLLQPLIGL